jgi:dimeric dUTPase (all-alpha-NTP-PPase superfamily)
MSNNDTIVSEIVISSLNLHKIFDMQRDLNCRIGRDTVGAENKMDWLFQYLFAAKVEGGELIDCFSCYDGILVEPDNAKVEIIDIFHFITSACHIVDITADDILTCHPYKSNPNLLFNVAVELDRYLESIITQNIDWKWWSASVKECPERQFKAVFNIDTLRYELKTLYQRLITAAHNFSMTDEDIFNIYQMKWEKNHKRQDDGYDVRTKTETDNQEIIANIQNSKDDSIDSSSVVENESSGQPEQGFTPQQLADIKTALETLKKSFEIDSSYAWSWFCNIKMPIFDYGGVSINKADEVAKYIMKHLFDYDVTKLQSIYK